MGDPEPKPEPALDPALIASATRHGFFAVVALLERMSGAAARVGGVGPVGDESIRFKHDPALTFSASDVSEVVVKQVPRDPNDPLSQTRPVYEVMTTFLGLTGSVTALPLFLAEEVAVEDADTPTQRQFLDIFHHRLISLLYRLGTKFDYPSEYRSDQSDKWSKRVLALAGFDTFESAPRSNIPAWRLLRLAPLLARRARTVWTLETALRDILSEVLGEVPIAIRQFVGSWTIIDPPQRMHLHTANSNLGVDTVLGTRMFDRAGKFRIVVGPFTNDTYTRFLPGGDQLPVIAEVVETFSRDQLEYDLELLLAEGSAPQFRLAATRKGSYQMSRLGRDTWLRRKQADTSLLVEMTAVPGRQA